VTTIATIPSSSANATPEVAPPGWLLSRRGDFWFACAGSSLALLVLLALLHFRGDRELDAADFLFAELHLGATYEVVVRKKLWQRMPWDILVIPLAIIALTYAFMQGGRSYLIATVLLYFAVWHRGRQSLGLGRWYQRAAGGVTSRVHEWLFRGAIYLPMIASVLFYTAAYPTQYEGEPYLPLVTLPLPLTFVMGGISAVWALVYLAWTWRRPGVHPGERWLVVAHTVAFGSAYLLGAWNASFIIVIALYHEVQYLYFTYAIARREALRGNAAPRSRLDDLRLLGSFALWPAIGLASTLLCLYAVHTLGWSWLAPSLVGFLLVHYWLDGRIWTRKANTPPKV
jgi:hypothetical protein